MPMIGRSTAEPDFAAAAGEVQVQQGDVPGRRDLDIARRHVAVHPARRVQRIEGFGRLPGDPQGCRHVELLRRQPAGPEATPPPATASPATAAARATAAASTGTKWGCETLCPTRASRCSSRMACGSSLPLGPEHLHGVRGRSIRPRPDRPRPIDLRKTSQCGKLDQLPLSYPTARLCQARHGRNGHVADRCQQGLGHAICAGKES